MDLQQYRQQPSEIARTKDLLRLLPAHHVRALDVGARDGFFSKLLAERGGSIVALDLERPQIDHPRIECVAGDLRALPYPDRYFDTVLCSEVLEHIGDGLAKACSELARVCGGTLVVGVPYRQDTRVGRTLCRKCGKSNPPWGHVNQFDEQRLRSLFPLEVIEESYVWQTRVATNWLSAALMEAAGHPWGTYVQNESCVHCGAELIAPTSRTFLQRLLSAASLGINKLQQPFVRPHANWIHIAFRGRSTAG